MSGFSVLPTVKPNFEGKASGSQFSKFSLLSLGALANIVIWGLAILYLKVTPKTYTSEWGVNVLGSARGVDVSLPEGWRATASPDGFKQLTSEDPRADYVYLVQSPDLLKAAADRLDLSVEDFGEAEVTTDAESSIIGFVIEGETPELAQKKALALYETLEERVEALRQKEISRRKEETLRAIDEARDQLKDSQVLLLAHKAQSGLSSEAQIQDLAVGIEQLRRQYAQSLAEERGVNSRAQQLERNIQEISGGASDAYRLLGDPVYQNQFNAYGIAAAEYASLAAQLGEFHPRLVEKRAEVNGLTRELEDRASFLLGRPVDQHILTELSVIAQDPSVAISRGSLFQETVVERANQIELQAQTQELLKQIDTLEGRLRNLSDSQVKADGLERDLQAAEAFFAASVTKLTLNEDDIYSFYPPIQLAAQPTLPEEDEYISPNPQLTMIGALAGSFLVVVGLILFWPKQYKGKMIETDALADLPFTP